MSASGEDLQIQAASPVISPAVNPKTAPLPSSTSRIQVLSSVAADLAGSLSTALTSRPSRTQLPGQATSASSGKTTLRSETGGIVSTRRGLQMIEATPTSRRISSAATLTSFQSSKARATARLSCVSRDPSAATTSGATSRHSSPMRPAVVALGSRATLSSSRQRPRTDCLTSLRSSTRGRCTSTSKERLEAVPSSKAAFQCYRTRRNSST